MSLVNDALKRARTEEQQRRARESGLPIPPPAPERLAPSPGSKLLPILAILGVVFLVGLLAGAITFVRNRAVVGAARGPASIAETSSVAQNSSAATPQSVRPAPEESQALPAPSAPSPSRNSPPSATSPVAATPAASTTPRSEPTPTPPVSTAPVTPRRSAPAEPRSTEPATVPASSTTGSVDSTLPGARDATSLDGRQLALGGIAWSETGPFALINGRVLAAGERIEGFKVIDIQKEQVELEDGEERILLRLR